MPDPQPTWQPLSALPPNSAKPCTVSLNGSRCMKTRSGRYRALYPTLKAWFTPP